VSPRRLAVAIVAVACVATASAQAPEPPLPAHNGRIAFSSDRGSEGTGRFRLYLLEPVGAAVTPLGLTGHDPAWSPDGSMTAFVQDRFKLVIARAGLRLRALESDYPLSDPAWSPDGSRIVVAQAIGRRFRNDLAVVDISRGGFMRLTRTAADDTEPTWSPDGRWITFVSDRAPEPGAADTELYHLQPNGRGLRRITANDYDDRSPAWSPDGTRIAFVSGRELGRFNPELWTIGPFGAPESRVQVASQPEWWGLHVWSDVSPAWSPDGRWLVYVTTQRWGWDDIFIVEVDTGAKFDLTPEASSFDWDPAWQPLCHFAGRDIGDVLRGGMFDDLVCGLGGRDTLVGGPGRDRLFGGPGNDSIRARDGERDIVGCGSGRDEVAADRVDLVGVDCERTRRG
jgi:dipeptidyl aminopeptidase/acylaminoacyl peptidase